MAASMAKARHGPGIAVLVAEDGSGVLDVLKKGVCHQCHSALFGGMSCCRLKPCEAKKTPP